MEVTLQSWAWILCGELTADWNELNVSYLQGALEQMEVRYREIAASHVWFLARFEELSGMLRDGAEYYEVETTPWN